MIILVSRVFVLKIYIRIPRYSFNLQPTVPCETGSVAHEDIDHRTGYDDIFGSSERKRDCDISLKKGEQSASSYETIEMRYILGTYAIQ